MGGYIGAKTGTLVASASDIRGDISATDTTPEITLKNTTETDADGGREGTVTFKGEKSGGEEVTLAQIEGSHDDTNDDSRGQLVFKTNNNQLGDNVTETKMTIDSVGDVDVTSGAPSITITNTTHEDTDGGREGKLKFKGEQSGGELSTLAQIEASHDGTADDEKGDLIFKTNDGNDGASPTERMRIDSDGDISFAGSLNKTAGTGSFAIETSGSSSVNLTASSSMKFTAATGGGSDSHQFINNTTEAMRIDSSGNVLVGGHTNTHSPISDGGEGVTLMPNGQVLAGGQYPSYFNREDSNGDIVVFRKDGNKVGSIGNSGNNLFVNSEGSGGYGRLQTQGTDRVIWFSSALYPANDNNYDLGASNKRYDDVYATNSTIQTSDENEKQNIAPLTSVEITAATAISKLFKTYKWKDKVAAKGDSARTHTGVVAQQVQTAMADAGLDASKYAFWCSDTWWEKDVEVAAVEADEENDIEAQEAYTRTDTYHTLDEAPEGATERTRMGIRYPELLAFVGAATEQRLTSIESRLTALEAE